MARLPRLALAGHACHVVQRGHDGLAPFADPTDIDHWHAVLRQVSRDHGLAIHAWVVLPDHFHLLATPRDDHALGRALQALGRRFARGWRLRHGGQGGLWRDRFQSALLEADPWVLRCARYLETHPVLSGLAVEPAHYRWSSYAHHVGLDADPLITDPPALWAIGNTPFERQAAWRRLVEVPLAEADLAALRQATRRGRPLGSPAFVEELLQLRPGPWRARPRGRPRKPV